MIRLSFDAIPLEENHVDNRYYTAIITMVWMSLVVLCVLIRESHRISKSDKRLMYLTYTLIALSALSEWAGIQLHGRGDLPRWMLLSVKCADYILSPMAGGALVAQMRLRNGWLKVLMGILVANTMFQLIGTRFGWVVALDEQGYYSHGPLYVVYLGICFAILSLIVIEFVVYGRAFRRQNRISLYAVMLFVVTGIVMQEALPFDVRTSYLALTMGAALMYIHFSDFSFQLMDDHLTAQQIEIDTDALTGVFSRHAYSRALKSLKIAGALPEDFAAVTIDINGLKQVNDTLGHEAGDELIIGAARCIERALDHFAVCYRTGGDEFVVLGRFIGEEAEMILNRIRRETARWQGESGARLSLSAGYALAADYPDLGAEKLVREADLKMYAAKADYYRNHNVDRRRR